MSPDTAAAPQFISHISVLWQQGGKKATKKVCLKALSARREID